MRYTFLVPRDAMQGVVVMQLGHKAGASVDFKDYREYQPGDDLRHIDWNVFARSDRLTIKMYREEISPHLDIVLDCSRSMALPGSEKARGLLGLGALLAAAASNARCSHAAWMSADECLPVRNGTLSPSVWDGFEFDSCKSPEDALHAAPPRWRPRGVRVLISDLLWGGDPLSLLRPFADRAAALIVIQLLAKADISPSLHGNVRLVDVETGAPLEAFVDTLVEKRYAENLSRHQETWHEACRQVGAVFAVATAESIVGNWRLEMLQEIGLLDIT